MAIVDGEANWDILVKRATAGIVVKAEEKKNPAKKAFKRWFSDWARKLSIKSVFHKATDRAKLMAKMTRSLLSLRLFPLINYFNDS